MPSHAKDLTTATIRDAEDDQVGNLTSSQALSENESCMSPGAEQPEGWLGMRSFLPSGAPITSNISHFKWEIWENHRLKGMPPRGGWLVQEGILPEV